MPQPRLRKTTSQASPLKTLTVRIDLVGAHPPIWRRLELRSDLTLDKVHALIQAVFEWENSHLHEFSSLSADGTMIEQRFESHIQQDVTKDMSLGLGGETATGSEEETTLGSLLRKPGDMLSYTYDFGDSWEHEIAVEKVKPAVPGTPLATCTGGAKAGPPDDCGGIWSYQQLVDLLKNPDHPDYNLYADQIEWVFGEGEIDPNRFDRSRAQRRVERAIATDFQVWWLDEDSRDVNELSFPGA